MKILILILGLFISPFVNSQIQDIAYLSMLGNQMRHIQPDGLMYYSDKPQKGRLEEILKVAPRELVRLKKRGLYFTSSEKKYIISSLTRAFRATQDDNLFPGSKRLPSDSIICFVETIVKRLTDSLRHLPDSTAAVRYYMHNKQWAFSFSDPILLRKGTILIYYFMYYINSSGEEAVWVCRRNDHIWTKIGVLGGGAW